MVIVYDEAGLDNYMRAAVQVSRERPVLIDKFLEDAFEVDVDALCDGEQVVIGGMMEHIEEAGIHSGDSSCVLPTYMVAEEHRQTIRDYTVRLGHALNVVGLMNVQYRHLPEQGLRSGSESAGLPHRTLREQGDRRAAGKACSPFDDRAETP